ncbi:MAG: hypothetical protein AB7Q29_04350 [Vicinamibacterales bacterium]
MSKPDASASCRLNRGPQIEYQKDVRMLPLLCRCVLGAVLAVAMWKGGAPLVLAAQTSYVAQALDPQEASVAQEIERVAGIEAETGAAFYRELRHAVGTDDRHSVCAMIAYPLDQSGGAVPDAAACEARYDAIFTVGVRRAIGRQQLKDLFVSAQGVVVGIGELRFEGTCATRPCEQPDVRIVAIDPNPNLTPFDGKVLIACRTSSQAIRVTADGAGGATLRVYDGMSAQGKPSQEIPKGRPTAQATGLCAWRAWAFDSTPSIEVAEVACATRRRRAPEGTLASVTKGDGLGFDDAEWCAE